MLRAIRKHDGTVPIHGGYVCLLDEGNWPRYYKHDELPDDVTPEDRAAIDATMEADSNGRT